MSAFEPKEKDLYAATMKHFGSEPEPAFEDAGRLERLWGRNWGCDSGVGKLRSVLMHRPGHEFDVIDPSKRIPETGAFGDIESGWYWQSDTIPDVSEIQAQHDAFTELLRNEGVEVVLLDEVESGRFKSMYTRDSCIAVKGGAIVTRLAPRMRHGEELPVTRKLAEIGMPILRTLHGTAMAEGGSFIWINPETAVIGRSIRVNDESCAQIAEVLKYQGVDLIVVDLCGYEIHIDGHFMMIDKDVALVQAPGLPFTFLERLRSMGITLVEMTEEDDPWVINGLAIAPGRYVVSGHVSTGTRNTLDKLGIELIEFDYGKTQLNGGGLHCSTSPLIRDSIA